METDQKIIIDPNSVNANSKVPLYKQVAQILGAKIQIGEWKTGDKIPSELVLMKMLQVSRITVRAAIAELVDDGFLERSQGKGTYVAQTKESQSASDNPGLTELCRRAGKTLSSKVLSIEYAYPTKKESEFLNIPENEQIIETKRLRSINGIPTLIEINHFPRKYKFLFDCNLEESLFKILEEKGLRVKDSTRTLEIAYATGPESSLLNVKKNSPLLLFHDYHKTEDGKPFYVSKQAYTTQNMIFYL